MRWSIAITTFNRAAQLRHTLEQLTRLSPPADEVIVCADGCTDQTTAIVGASFPNVRLLENPFRIGSVPSRDRMMRVATAELVLSLDDDSYPIETSFLASAAQLFAADPMLAVLWFPQRTDEFPASLQMADFGTDRTTGTYSSSGAVLRRSTYLALPGYVDVFEHAYEETDYALQCIAAGWHVRQHTGLTIRHHYSSRNRNECRIHQFHARNEQWSIWLRCPWPWWPLMSIRRAVGQFVYAIKRGPSWVVREPIWWWSALRGISPIWRQRRPVAWRAYRRWLQLLRQPKPVANTALTAKYQ